MLGRVLKPNFEALRRDAAKKLLIWSRNKRAEFCTSFEDHDSFQKNKFSQRRGNFSNLYEDDDYYYNRRRTPFTRRDRDNYDDNFDNDRFNFKRKSYNSFNLRKEDINFGDNLKSIVKDYYKPHDDVLNRSTEEINEFRKKHDIVLFGKSKSSCPPPILSFNEIDLPSEVSSVISKLNYTSPTPVQSQTWPIVLSGQNMVGISRTGSGKTLGFILPAMIHIKHQPALERGEGPIALVVAPTRELVQQIVQVTAPFVRSLDLNILQLYGGTKKNSQIERLYRGAEICVATPGRLNDILSSDFMRLDKCSYLVLDEADRLLDMGFHPQIKSIFHYCRPDRQVSMWSATWPDEVQNLAEDFLKNYIAVKFGSSQLSANPNIKQYVHVCEEREKLDLLKDLLEKISKTEDKKTLIFTCTKAKTDRLERLLKNEGFECDTIHGDKSQRDRDYSLKMFRSGQVKILIGTEVVGRGIDIDDIRYVINYDFPPDIESYVHIIGRTARKDSPGTSHTFFTVNDAAKARDLIKILNQAKQDINPELEEIIRRGFDRAPGRSRSRYQRKWSEI